jgi:hypothetical protein
MLEMGIQDTISNMQPPMALDFVTIRGKFRVFDIEPEFQTGVEFIKSHINRKGAFSQCSLLADYSIFTIFPARWQSLVR